MNNILIEQYKALLFILSIPYKDQYIPVIDSRTGEVFLQRIGEDKEIKTLKGEVEFNYETSNFINFSNLSEKTGKYQQFIGFLTEQNRKFIRALSESASGNTGFKSEGNPFEIGNSVADTGKLLGKNRIDRRTISQNFTGDKHTLLKNIEKLVNELVENTNKESTMTNVATIYDNACQIATTKGNPAQMQQLRDVESDLNHRREKQMQRIAQTELERENSPAKHLKIKAIGMFLGFMLFIFVANSLYKHFNTNVQQSVNNVVNQIKTELPIEVQSGILYSKTEIEFFIIAYNENPYYKNKIWNKRKELIVTALSTKRFESNVELIKAINNFSTCNFIDIK